MIAAPKISSPRFGSWGREPTWYLPAPLPSWTLARFIHVEDLVTVLLAVAEFPPPSGETATYLVQAEARSLADVSQMVHARLDVPFRPVEFSERVWRLIRKMCYVALHLKGCVPCDLYAAWWRLRIASENIFWCETAKLRAVLPAWKPLSIEDRIGECL